MIEIFEFKNGFGFKGSGVHQDYDPELEGFVVMTKERAEQCAAQMATRLEMNSSGSLDV